MLNKNNHVATVTFSNKKRCFPPKKTKYVNVGQTIVRFSIRVVHSSFEVEGQIQKVGYFEVCFDQYLKSEVKKKREREREREEKRKRVRRAKKN